MAAKDAVLELRFGGRETLLGLSLLYDAEGWGTTRFHQDHVFPRSKFNDAALASRGYDAEQRARYREKMNSLANLQLLREDENAAKLACDPEEWLATRDRGFRRRHLIPEDMVLDLDAFEEFIDRRENLIRARLDELLETHAFGAQAKQSVD